MNGQSANLFDFLCPPDQHCNRVAIWRGDADPITYGDLGRISARMAHRLVNLGVEPGDRVAVQVEKSAEVLALYLACLRAGAVYLPLNNGYTLTELEYFIADAQPRVFVAAPGEETSLRGLADTANAVLLTLGANRNGSFLEGVEGLPDVFDTVPRQAGDLAAILYTSGTTGRPKGAMLSHGNLHSNATVLAAEWFFTAGDVLLHALPVYHTHGLFVATNVTLLSRASMNLLPKFDLDQIFAVLPQASVMMGVPTFYTRMLADLRMSRAATAHMRLFISGSAPLLAQTHEEWENRTGHRILERYGMTETNMNASNPYEGERKPGTVGQPLPGVTVRIVDPDTGNVMPSGEIGMIEVRGPNVFQGYWRKPEQTAADLRPDGFFITGDLGRFDSDGYLEIVGRGKDLVISGGLNVYPKEVEQGLDALDPVVESAVIGLAHPDLGEAVTAVVEARGETEGLEQALISSLRNSMAAFKLPKRVIFVDALPRNAMGKIQKNVLRERYAGLYD